MGPGQPRKVNQRWAHPSPRNQEHFLGSQLGGQQHLGVSTGMGPQAGSLGPGAGNKLLDLLKGILNYQAGAWLKHNIIKQIDNKESRY